MTFHDVIILIKSVFHKDKNNYYYNIFLEKDSYELSKEWVTYRFSYAIRHNDANKMTLHPLPPAICVIPRISIKSIVF